MDDLVTWLSGCLDERAAQIERMRQTADDVARLWGHGDPPGDDDDLNPADRIWFYVQDEAARVLAEVEAKRAIMAGHPPVECSNVRCPVGLHCGTCEYDDPSGNHWPCLTARALALPYRDRPGYRLEWAPE